MEKYRQQMSLETDAVPPSASASNYGNRSSQHPQQAMFSRNRIPDEEIFTHHPHYPRNSDNHPLEPEDLVHFVVLYAKQNYGECKIFINWLQEILKKSGLDDVTIEYYDSEVFPPHEVYCITEICNRAMFILPFLTKEFCTDATLKFFTVEGICLTRLDKSPISGEFSRINKSQKKYSIRPVHTEGEGVRYYRTPTGLTGTRGIDYYNKDSDTHKDYIANQVCGLAKEAIRKFRQRKDAMRDVLTGSEDFYARFESAFNRNNPPPVLGNISSPQSSHADSKRPIYYDVPSLQNSTIGNPCPPVDSFINNGNSQIQQFVPTSPQGLEHRTQQNGGIQPESSVPHQTASTNHQIRAEDRNSVQMFIEGHDQENQAFVQHKTQIKDNVTRIGQVKKNIGFSDQPGFSQNQKPDPEECSGIATTMPSSEELMISGILESSRSDQNEKLPEACSENSADMSSVDGRVLTNSRGYSAISDLCHIKSHLPTESSGTSSQDSSASLLVTSESCGTSSQDSSASPLVTSESCGTSSQSSSATPVVPSDLSGTSSQDFSAVSDNKTSVQESGHCQDLIESGKEQNDDSFTEDCNLTLDAAPSTMPREVLSPESHGFSHLDNKQNSKDSTLSGRTQDTPDTPSEEHNVTLCGQSNQQDSGEVRQDSRNVRNVEEDLKLQQVNIVTKDDCDEGIKEDYMSYTGPAKMRQSKYASASTSMSDFKEQVGESDRRHEVHVHIHHHNPPVLQKPEKQSIVISNCNVVQIGEKSTVRKTTTLNEEEESLTDSSFHSSNHEMSWNNLSSEITDQNAVNELTECKLKSFSSSLSENENRTSQSDDENFSQDNLPSRYESERGTQKIINGGAHSQVESYDGTCASDVREDERDSFLDEQLNDPSMPSLAPFEIGIKQPSLLITCKKGIDQSCRSIYRKFCDSYSYAGHVGELLGLKNSKDIQITDSMEEEID